MPQKSQSRTRKVNPGFHSSATIPFAKVHVKVAQSVCPLDAVFGSIRSFVTRSSCLETGHSCSTTKGQFNIATIFQSENQTTQNFEGLNKLEHSANTIVFPHRLLRIKHLDPIRLSIPTGTSVVTVIINRNSATPSHVQVSVEPKPIPRHLELRIAPPRDFSANESSGSGLVCKRGFELCNMAELHSSSIGMVPLEKSAQTREEGVVVLCNNCGIYSSNLETCSRCGKIIKSPVIVKDPLIPGVSSKTKTPRAEDIVLLSSDEESESRKNKKVAMMERSLLSSFHNITAVNLSSHTNGSSAAITPSKSPDEVITEIEQLTGGSNTKTAFTTLMCRAVSVGSYKVTSSQMLKSCLSVTFSEFGILFNLPHRETKTIQKCAVAPHQILTVYVNFHGEFAVFVIVTGPKVANSMRKQLGINHDSSGDVFYCPLNGDETQKHLTFRVPALTEIETSIIRRIYGRSLVEWDETICKLFLEKIGLIHSTDASNRRATKARSANKPTLYSGPEESEAVISEVHKLFQYPEIGLKDSIVVHSSDVACLAEEQFLNDQIIDFYLRYFLDSLPNEDRSMAYVYNTFFYKRLTTRPKRKSSAPWEFDSALSIAQKRHARVKSWTKKIDIFERNYLFVPINESSHWFLAVICFPGLQCPVKLKTAVPVPWLKNVRKKIRKRSCSSKTGELDRQRETICESDKLDIRKDDTERTVLGGDSRKLAVKQPCILIFDSLAGAARSRVSATLREYLREEFKVRKGHDRYFDRHMMPGYQPKVPQQPNNCDCGVYSIQYAESFFASPLDSYYFPISSLWNWFPESAMQSKRKQIYCSIIDLINKKYPENAGFVPKLDFVVEDLDIPNDDTIDKNAQEQMEVDEVTESMSRFEVKANSLPSGKEDSIARPVISSDFANNQKREDFDIPLHPENKLLLGPPVSKKKKNA